MLDVRGSTLYVTNHKPSSGSVYSKDLIGCGHPYQVFLKDLSYPIGFRISDNGKGYMLQRLGGRFMCMMRS